MAQISPLIIDHLQSSFMMHINQAFAVVSQYAIDIFYLIAVIELVLFGVVFALKKDQGLGLLIMKLFKLGVIFAVISMYPLLLQSLIDGFTFVAFKASPSQGANLLFHPSHLFKYGFNVGASLLKVAVQYGSFNGAMANIYEILGFGILILLTLIVAQIMLCVVGFYLISLLALLLLPLGAFSATKNLFEKAIQSVFSAGARVFAIIFVVGIAASVWASVPNHAITQTTSLVVPLSWFFALIVVTVLSIFIPKLAGQTIGHFSGLVWTKELEGSTQTSVIQTASTSTAAVSHVTAGTTLSPNAVGERTHSASPGAVNVGSKSSLSQSVSMAASGAKVDSSKTGSSLGSSAEVKVSISDNTLKKIKSSIGSAIHKSSKKP